jgi:hypothetical protein
VENVGRILCKDYTKRGIFSAKLAAEWKKPTAMRVWCITYTSIAPSSAKLPSMIIFNQRWNI